MESPVLWDMLHNGDWACAHADDQALRDVAHMVSPELPAEMRKLAEHIELLSEKDMSAASLLWGLLAERVRHSPVA